jgi:hypothetical protein
MSNNDPKPLTSQIAELHPRTADRTIMLQLARGQETIRRDLSLVAHEQQRQGLLVAEIHGHVLRVDSTTRQVSSNDLAQEARLAELESNWKRFWNRVDAALSSPMAKRLAVTAIGSYLVEKETGALHALGKALLEMFQ